MKRLPTIAAAALFAFGAGAMDRPIQVIHGPYEARLSGYCRSITDQDASSGPSGDFRVRRGASLTASGKRHTIVVDDGATVRVTGQASVVFVQRGGTALIDGRRHHVFMESGSQVTIIGSSTTGIATVGELDIKLNRNADECR
jgi:hypothetical protein